MIDRDGEVWTARLGEHKTAHHGHERNLFFGPKAQAIVAPYLLRSANDCLFRLCDTVKKRRAIASEARTTPMSCGNRPGSNRKSSPMRTAGTEYEPAAYARAITRAAERAGVDHWTPNQLRHTRATEVRKLFGLEAAQVVLGHAGAFITQVYAERDATKAKEVALKTG